MKFRPKAIVLAGVLAVATGVSSVAKIDEAKAEEVFVFSSYLPEVFPIAKVNHWMMDEIEQRTDGEIKFERYFGGTLLKAADTFPGIAQGAADMGMGAPGAYNRNEYRLSNISLPFITENAAAANHAAFDLFQSNENLQREYESQNVVALLPNTYAENSYWSSSPLRTTSDIEGKRVRAVQDIATAVQKMGGTPVSISYSEAVEGLPRGVIDALSSVPLDGAVLGGIYETVKFGSDIGGMGIFSLGITAVNKDRWDALTEEQRTIFREVAEEALPRYLDLMQTSVEDAVQKICDYEGDLTISRFSPEEKETLRTTVGQEIHDEWVEWASANGDAEQLLEDYKALVSEYEGSLDWTPAFQLAEDKNCKVE